MGLPRGQLNALEKSSRSFFKVTQEFFSSALIPLPDWTLVYWVHGASKRTAEHPWEIFKVFFSRSLKKFFSLTLITLPDWTLVHWVHGATKRTAERPWEIFQGHFSRSLKNFSVWLWSLYQTEHLCTGFMGLQRGQLNTLEKSSRSFFKVAQEFFSSALIALPDWTLVYWVHGATKRTAEHPWEIFWILQGRFSRSLKNFSVCLWSLYQTEHLCTGFMGLPRGQLNALEKSSEFFRGTCALKNR